MKTKLIALLALSFVASSSFASLLTTSPSSQNLEGVQLAKEGSVNVEDQQIPVSSVGAGLRTKRVAIVNVKVYVAEVLSSDSSQFVRTEAGALSSLSQARTVAVRMNFLRNVDAPTVQSAFADGFRVNGVSVTEPSIQQFLTAVAQGGDAVAGKSLTIVTSKNADKTENVYYEDSNGKLTKVPGTEGLSQKILALWLGAAADGGVQKMKEQIIQGQ